MNDTVKKRLAFLINIVFFAVIIALAVLFIKYALTWVLPFLLALLAVAAVEPLVRRLCERVRIKRSICAVFMVLVVWLVVALLLYVLLAAVFGEMSSLAANWQVYMESAQHWANNFIDWFEEQLALFPAEYQSLIRDGINELQSSLGSFASSAITSLFNWVRTIAMRLPWLLFFLLITIVSSCFLAADYPRIKLFVSSQFTARRFEAMRHTKEFISNTGFKFLRAYTILLIITFSELVIGLSILRIPYAFTLALVIAFIDLLPVLGTGTILIPWGVIWLFAGNVWGGALILVLYLLMTIVRQIIEPRIVGQQIGLHPLVTLISMYIGLQALGFIGMFLLPLTILFLKRMQEHGYFKLWKSPSEAKAEQEQAGDEKDLPSDKYGGR